jgi:beta-galactosidase
VKATWYLEEETTAVAHCAGDVSRPRWGRAAALALCALLTAGSAPGDEPAAAPLPPRVRAEWSLERAWRESTPTRERVCLNGLWRWQPAKEVSPNETTTPPSDRWGWFKVPGPWPGISDYMQKDSQSVHVHPAWKEVRLGDVAAAWYEREVTVPAQWTGRRVALRVEYLNSLAMVFVDGRKVGELRFPAGELDLTAACQPGRRHVLSLLVVALPLKGVLLSYADTAAAREVRGAVARRGLCGDVFLCSRPPGARLDDVQVRTSVRRWELTLDTALSGLEPGKSYRLHARITEQGREVKAFQSRPFTATDAPAGRFVFTESWRPEKLWDLHTPQHQYELELSLREAEGRLLDALPPVRFGFREFWIEGRDFYLNNSRIFLSAVPLDNAQVSAAAATYEAARESLDRLRSFGINFVYTHNYDCLPGAHLSFSEILRAADDLGMLVALTQPHFSHYDWSSPEADRTNGYAPHAAFYARVAGNHPSVVAYATSHNATGYNEDMNPDLMDGRSAPRDTWARRNVERALRAEAIIRARDPGRFVYHHASGNLGPMHAVNFYPNFVPVQELSDWFEHWATHGIKPVFLCEYGAPFTWDWAMYRGWYKGRREFGSAVVPWEFCLAEWNAQFFGDRAFAISETEKRNLRWEARQFRAGRLWHRWDYPHQLGSTDFPEREPVFALYFTDNWRAFRTWGLSANSPWEHHILFKLRPGVDRHRRQDLPVDWANLQRPGYSPDFLGERFERMDMAYERSDWLPTGAGQAMLRNNRPLLAWLAGKPARFTSKDHLFEPGETFEKQLILINNSRLPVRAGCEWTLGLPSPQSGRTNLSFETGQQARLPLRFTLPAGLAAGEYKLTARVNFDTGEVQADEFSIEVLPPQPARRALPQVALFDPKGETRAWLEAAGVKFRVVDAAAQLGPGDLLVVGKGALSVDGPAPDLRAVRDGLRVLVFEQAAEALEQRLGFRVAEYGLRQAFVRVPDHPAAAGLRAEHLRDWRGAAILLPPRLKYELNPKFNGAPTVTWCGLPVTRAWRCGNQGNVASVLIEKPARGDFLPLVDGGFSLQYSPLLEYREGAGVVLFCQLDVTGRTEREPVAERLKVNLLDYLAGWKPGPKRQARYAGAPEGRTALEAAGARLATDPSAGLTPDQVLVVGPGGATELAGQRDAVATFLKAGGRLLALGWTQADADALLPFQVNFTQAEHINAVFDPPGVASPLAGLDPADVHCRDPRVLPLVSGGAQPVGDGVLAEATNAHVVFCQLLPWQFDYANNYGLKRTFRRAAFLVNRLLANLGVRGQTPLLSRWAAPVRPGEKGRWLEGLYLDPPEGWDDPYRFFRW